MMQASERKKREHNIDSFVVIKPEKMFHRQKNLQHYLQRQLEKGDSTITKEELNWQYRSSSQL